MGRKPKPVDEQYHVECVLAARHIEETTWEYYVRWGFYPESANSWEPEKGLMPSCTRLLNSFWRNIGPKSEITHGEVLEPTAGWIAKEKRRFQRGFTPEQYQAAEKQAKRQQEEEARQNRNESGQGSKSKSVEKEYRKKQRSSTRSKASLRKRDEPGEESDSEDDVPLTNLTPAKLGTIRIPASAKRTADQMDVDSSDSEPPATPQKMSKTFIDAVPNNKAKDHRCASQASSTENSHTLNTVPPIAKAWPRSSPIEDSTAVNNSDSNENRPLRPNVKTVLRPISHARPSTSTMALSPVAPPPAGLIPLGRNVDYGAKLKGLRSTRKLAADVPGVPATTQVMSPVTPNIELRASPSSIPDDAFPGLFSEEEVQSPAAPYFQDNIELLELDNSLDIAPMMEEQPRDEMAELADQFLRSVIPEMAAPLIEPVEEQPDSSRVASNPFQPSRTLAPVSMKLSSVQQAKTATSVLFIPKPLPRTKIPKKKSWKGKLFANMAEGKAEKLCSIMLHEMTEPVAEGARLEYFLHDAIDSLHFGKSYTLSQLDIVLSACSKCRQWAKVSVQDDADDTALKGLVSHLAKQELVAIAPLHHDSRSTAMLIILPGHPPKYHERLLVPHELRKPGYCVAALFCWGLSQNTYDDSHPTKTPFYSNKKHKELTSIDVDAKKEYRRAIHYLQMPSKIQCFISRPNRPYCVWAPTDDKLSPEAALEIKLLKRAMTEYKAQEMPVLSKARIVFIHVAALDTVHRIPALVESRAQRPDLTFILFGTCSMLPSTMWGLKEVYPTGGVLTFTHNALLQDPDRTKELIEELDGHPLWTCYILPTVIGMVAKITADDALAAFDKGAFAHDYLLQYAVEGRFAILNAPPSHCQPDNRGGFRTVQNGDTDDWVSQQLSAHHERPRALLEHCINSLHQRHPAIITPIDGTKALLGDIDMDILTMQVQPSLMQEYRRFVVIEGSMDKNVPHGLDGTERMSAEQFEFRDNWWN